MKHYSPRMKSAVLWGLLGVVSVTFFWSRKLLSDESRRSDDPQVRWETEHAKWDKSRGTWDTEPMTYTLRMPDYHHASRIEWRDQSNEVCTQLTAVANEALHWVSDTRLPIEQRTRALSIVELFSVEVTADKLIEVIDLKDERMVHFSEISRGRYPVVSILKNYGTSVIPHVDRALANETQQERRTLLCTVLERVLAGTEPAIEELTKYAGKKDWNPEQRKNLQSALEELRQRNSQK